MYKFDKNECFTYKTMKVLDCILLIWMQVKGKSFQLNMKNVESDCPKKKDKVMNNRETNLLWVKLT